MAAEEEKPSKQTDGTRHAQQVHQDRHTNPAVYVINKFRDFIILFHCTLLRFDSEAEIRRNRENPQSRRQIVTKTKNLDYGVSRVKMCTFAGLRRTRTSCEPERIIFSRNDFTSL